MVRREAAMNRMEDLNVKVREETIAAPAARAPLQSLTAITDPEE